MESEVVNEQEDELQGITGLRRLDSESSENSSEVILEFETGSDIDSKVVKVSNRLDQVREYPDDAERPVITTVDPRANAMAWFILKPLPDNPADINLYYDFADEIIRTRLERVPGVGASNVFGGRERLIEVLFDPAALAKRNITIAELAASIDRENENFSAGSFSEGKRQYLVRTVGEYRTTRDIGNIVVATAAKAGLPVYLRDVATVRLGYEDPGYTVRQNGDPAIAVNVLRESGANSMDVKEALFAAVEELNTGRPQGKRTSPPQCLRRDRLHKKTR